MRVMTKVKEERSTKTQRGLAGNCSAKLDQVRLGEVSFEWFMVSYVRFK